MKQDLDTTMLHLRTPFGGAEIDLKLSDLDATIRWITSRPQYDHYHISQVRYTRKNNRIQRTPEANYFIYPYDAVRETLALHTPGAQDDILERVNVKEDEEGAWVRPEDLFTAVQAYKKR